ncbi:hypothetical protein MHC_03395 [Mycoplasma haemocanis str. Illinois]|uniref:Uncharacterized protein n=1 Tax=Mycoplasma haemocanis (strain Illinois) TaxID=1111676 RepID=H6N7B7_MYCHN|nr:hypothetical protein [Mycoplasma haemocanis]AEW45539.1 hypothetical protein MHC_03395 [Mycoplasma haemocanis str. Illinois]
MVFSSGSFWGGIFLVGASVGVGSLLIPEQIFEVLELTSAKTKSAGESKEQASPESIKEDPKLESISTSSSSEGKSDVKESSGEVKNSDTSTTLPKVVSEKTGCVIHQLISSRPWQFKKFGSGESFLKGRQETAAYNRIKEACAKAKGGDILITNKYQSWWSLRPEWDYIAKDQDITEFKEYLSRDRN